MGVAGVGDVVVLRDELLKLVGKGLTSEEEDIVDVDGNDKGVCNPSNLSVEDERVRVGLSMFKTKVLHTGGKGSITQWVHAEYIVGSETIYLPFTQWVRGGYFSKVPTKVPTR